MAGCVLSLFRFISYVRNDILALKKIISFKLTGSTHVRIRGKITVQREEQ